jgi:hypothetical protein
VKKKWAEEGSSFVKRKLYQETGLAASKELEKNQFLWRGKMLAEEKAQKKAEPRSPALFQVVAARFIAVSGCMVIKKVLKYSPYALITDCTNSGKMPSF